MIKPIRDILVLRPLADKVGMIGRIHLPEIGKLSCKSGGTCEVIAAGPQCESVRAGDRVHVAVYDKKYAGDEIEIAGERLLLLRERDINGLVDPS